MTNRTLLRVRVRVGVTVRAWIKIYIRVLRARNYYHKSQHSNITGSPDSITGMPRAQALAHPVTFSKANWS